jgi:hypothetical protein
MKKPDNIDLPALANEYAGSIVQALAIAQQNKQINGPADLQLLIAAGIETGLEDFLEKLDNTPKIELG